MSAYTDADVQAAARAIVVARVSKEGGMSPSDTARTALDAVAKDIAARAQVAILREAAEDCRAELGNEVHGHTSTYSVRRWLHERANKMVQK